MPYSSFKPTSHRKRKHSHWHFTYLTAFLIIRKASMVYCLDNLWNEDNWEYQKKKKKIHCVRGIKSSGTWVKVVKVLVLPLLQSFPRAHFSCGHAQACHHFRQQTQVGSSVHYCDRPWLRLGVSTTSNSPLPVPAPQQTRQPSTPPRHGTSSVPPYRP